MKTLKPAGKRAQEAIEILSRKNEELVDRVIVLRMEVESLKGALLEIHDKVIEACEGAQR